MKPPPAGFTLVELLVALGIAILLAALCVPVYQRVAQSGRATACVSNLRQLGVALGLYLGEHDQVMPTLVAARADSSEQTQAIDTALLRYAGDSRVFLCPADGSGIGRRTGTSYYWNSALNGQAASNLNFMKLITDASRIPVMSDKQGFHPYTENKVNVLYADGHASKELAFFTGN